MTLKKQTFEDILHGEEPTDEYLEEFNAINNSSISDEEIERQAIAINSEDVAISIKEEPPYKTAEGNFSSVLIIGLVAALVIVGYQKFIA